MITPIILTVKLYNIIRVYKKVKNVSWNLIYYIHNFFYIYFVIKYYCAYSILSVEFAKFIYIVYNIMLLTINFVFVSFDVETLVHRRRS